MKIIFISNFYKNINKLKINFRLLFLVVISIVISFYYTFHYKNYYPYDFCYSTASSFFYKFLDNILSQPNIDYIIPEKIVATGSFSFSLLIFSFLKIWGFTDCQSIGFIRFIIHLMPYLGLSFLSEKLLKNEKTSKFFAISILLIFTFRIFFYLPSLLSLSFLSFNYPWLLSNINSSIHINGILLNSFIFLYFPILLYCKNFYLKNTVLIMGGLINPIIVTAISFFYYAFDNLRGVNNLLKAKIIKIGESLIPILSYILFKFIWNIFHFRRFIFNREFPNQEKTDLEYLKFIDINDLHRNNFDLYFFKIFKKFIPDSINPEKFELNNNNYLPIIISYLPYIIILILLIIFFKIFIKSYLRNVLKKYSLINENLNLLRAFNFVSYFLLFTLVIDFFIKFFNKNLINLIPKLYVFYNQIYLSRLVNVFFQAFYFIVFFISAILIIHIFYNLLMNIKLKFLQE